MIVDRIDDLIGNTPLMLLSSVSDRARGINVYGKLEYFNPGLSVKDRSALQMMRQAEIDNHLTEGSTIVESSSGNTGHALAMLCAANKYKFICILDPKTPKSNINLVKAFGGQVELVEVPDASGTYQKKRIARAKAIAEETPNCFNLDQYSNPAAVDAHHLTTGPEISRDLSDKIDIIIGSASTGSHLSGVARYFKEKNDRIITVGVEPAGSVIFGGEYQSFLQNGSGLSFQPGNMLFEYVDETVRVTDHDAFLTCREMAMAEGLLLGGSSGSVIHAARSFISTLSGPANIILILADGGVKYLDTIYNDSWLCAHGLSSVVDAASRGRAAIAGDNSRPADQQVHGSGDNKAGEPIKSGHQYAFSGNIEECVNYSWPGKVDDNLAQKIIKLLRGVSTSTPIVGFGEVISEKEGEAYIDDLRTDLSRSKYALMTVVTNAGELIGMCTLRRNADPNNRHIANLAKGMIRSDFRGGIVLLAAFHEIVRRCEREGIELLTLDVRDGTTAHQTWSRLGFKTYGTLPDYARVDGQSVSGHFMMQNVQDVKALVRSIVQSRFEASVQALFGITPSEMQDA